MSYAISNGRARTEFCNDSEPIHSRMEPMPVMDEDDHALTAYQEASRRGTDFITRTNLFICGAIDPAERLLRYECCLLATGQYHILNVNSGDALAKIHGVGRACVNRIIRRYQTFLKMPKVGGQHQKGGDET
jgi:hypothetical protein